MRRPDRQPPTANAPERPNEASRTTVAAHPALLTLARLLGRAAAVADTIPAGRSDPWRPAVTAPELKDRLLDKRAVAARWSCSTKQVERLVAIGVLRPIRIGRLVRFRREDVLAAEKKMQK